MKKKEKETKIKAMKNKLKCYKKPNRFNGSFIENKSTKIPSFEVQSTRISALHRITAQHSAAQRRAAPQRYSQMKQQKMASTPFITL